MFGTGAGVSMRFDLLTLFPALFESYLRQSLLKRALERGLVEINTWNFRDWATDRHQSVDDTPYGGGPGMLLRCQPVFDCVEHVQQQGPAPGRLVMLTPSGARLNQRLVEELATTPRFLLLCGRYEGFDERIRLGLQPLEISIGDCQRNVGCSGVQGQLCQAVDFQQILIAMDAAGVSDYREIADRRLNGI